MTPTLNLEELTLRAGSHQPSDGAMCVMEAAAYMAGEPWSDHPECVSPVIAAFLRSWNDTLPDSDRGQLVRYLANVHDGGVLGTGPASPELENRRSWLAVDWSVRAHTPAWLRLAGLDTQADTLENLPEILNPTTAAAIRPALDAVRKDAHAAAAAAGVAAWAAAVDAAGDAAGDAAVDAAWAAARDAAWAAAGDAVGDAARDAAWAAAGVAAGDAAGDAAWVAAGDAAWAAAAAAAWVAAGDAAWAAAAAAAWVAAGDAAWAAAAAAWAAAAAGAAARAAAGDALAPTVALLQESAHELVVRMATATFEEAA